VTATAAGPKTRQGACRVARVDHASERHGFCRTHRSASTLVSAGDYRARVRGSRFLETDPIEGGSANDYDYVSGDPCNKFDLNGTDEMSAPTPFKVERLAGPCAGSGSSTSHYKFRNPVVVRVDYMGSWDLSGGEGYLIKYTFKEYGYAGARAVTSCESGYLMRRHYYERPVHRNKYYYQWILTVSGPSYGAWRPGH
jgi:hypothetical protein